MIGKPRPYMRFRVAYLKIMFGLTIKEIAQRLNIGEKLADYYWHTAKRKIRTGRISL